MHRPAAIMLIACMLLLSGCYTAPPRAATPPTEPAYIQRNYGYALLYATIRSETQVADVLKIKSARDEVATLLKDIAAFAKDALNQLDNLAAADPSLGFDIDALPEMESRTRQAIENTTTAQVLMHSGRRFEFTILLTQHEALNYISHLAGVLRRHDSAKPRMDILEQIQRDAQRLHARTIELLRRTDHPTPEASQASLARPIIAHHPRHQPVTLRQIPLRDGPLAPDTMRSSKVHSVQTTNTAGSPVTPNPDTNGLTE